MTVRVQVINALLEAAEAEYQMKEANSGDLHREELHLAIAVALENVARELSHVE